MSYRVLASVLTVILVSNVVFAEEAPKTNHESEINSQNWFVAFDEAAFSDNMGITVHDIPTGTEKYQKKFTPLAPRFTVGYRVTPRWSVDLQLQLGPRESFVATKDDEVLPQSAWLSSRFMSASTARALSLGRGYELEAKVGVVLASIKSRVKTNTGQLRRLNVETKPMLSIGLRKKLADRLTGGIEFTNYFLSGTGSVSTSTFGLRFDF